MNGGRFDEEDPEKLAFAKESVDENIACIAFRGQDVAAIAFTMKRLSLQNDERNKRIELLANTRVLVPLEPSVSGKDAFDTLMRDGCLRLNDICSKDMCARILDDINTSLAHEIAIGNPQTVASGFGNVMCRESRWDMYLPDPNSVESAVVYRECLQEMFGSDTSPLSLLFSDLFDGNDSAMHEFSSLISDCGSLSQPIHPDSKHDSQESDKAFTQIGPMYTVFLALQDIDEAMGPTLFLPRTNTAACHEAIKSESHYREFLVAQEYRMALLRQGDVAIMDSRCLHGGLRNASGPRRALLYLTLKHPTLFSESTPPIPRGSLHVNICPHMKDFRLQVNASSVL
jgi:hypothetical protein